MPIQNRIRIVNLTTLTTFLAGYSRSLCLLILVISAFTLTSCSMGGPMYGPVDKSIVEIREGIIKALPIKINYANIDSREYRSVPFVRYGTKIKEATNELQRAYALIYIRGNKRPYTIEVVVGVEEAESPLAIQKGFKTIGYDERIAKIILARLKAHLNKRREDSNLVDDFKIF
jgi:hypothetical protein